MHALLLGAGASKCAGYPLASEIIPELKKEAETRSSGFVNFVRSWDSWEESIESSKGLIRRLLNNPNPEVVLSVPDLCEAAWNAELQQSFSEGIRAWRGEIPATVAARRTRARVITAHRFQELIVAIARFRDCLDMYFRFKHFEDFQKENRQRRDYLRRLLSNLTNGDFVVTLNWDTTVERTLLEDRRWTPRDGYGFVKKLLYETKPARRFRLPRSQVTVLKLHGSVGWYRSQQKLLCFDSRHGFLKYLPVATASGESIIFRDPTDELGPRATLIMAYPSFLKQLAGAEMQEIWRAAARVMLDAESIEVWGYSLPESDAAVRTILTPLRSRLASGSVRVNVHDPNGDVRRRWKDLLGNRAEIDSQALGHN